MGNKEDKLKEILKRMHHVKPSDDFTPEIMREVEAMAEHRDYANEKIKSLLQNSSQPAPSNAFTYSVLNAIRETPSRDSKPVISKGVWIGILSFVSLCIIVAMLSTKGDSSSENFYVMPVGDYLSNLFGRYREIILYAGITFASGSLLLLVDYRLNKSPKLER